MSILMVKEEADFVYLKEKTESTAGNLSVQLDKLSGAGYIVIEKGFEGKRPRTTCRITPEGKAAETSPHHLPHHSRREGCFRRVCRYAKGVFTLGIKEANLLVDSF